MRINPISNTNDALTLRSTINALASQISDSSGAFVLTTGTQTMVSVPNVTQSARVLLTPYNAEAAASQYFVKSVVPGMITVGHLTGPAGRKMAFLLTEIT